MSSPRRSNRTRLVLLVLLVGGAALIALITRRSAPASDPPPAPLDLNAIKTIRALDPRLARRREAAIAHAVAGKPRTLSSVDYYLAQSRYPPASRPLDRSTGADLIDWNVRADDPHPTKDDRSVEFLYSGDLTFVIGNRPITTYLRVRRNDQPLEVKITQAFILLQASRGEPLPPEAAKPIPLAYTYSNGMFISTFRPADLAWLRRSVDLRFQIEFDYGGPSLQRASLVAQYHPTAGAPARFTGQFRETIEEGSLVVYAGVEVVSAGFYNMDCNLWDARSEPVAWTRFKGDLTVGTHEVPFQFFGRVLVDSSSTSPWRVSELRGLRYNADASPPEEMMDPFGSNYTTRQYALSQFSAAEWDSPERDRTLQSLLEDEARGQLPPIPAEALENDVPRGGNPH